MIKLQAGIKEKFHKLAVQEETDSDWEPVISIGTAAKMVNLSPSALRKYEREGLLIFYRTETGRRLLSLADLKRIRMIQRMIHEVGLNMEGIRRLLSLLPCWDIKPCEFDGDHPQDGIKGGGCVACTHSSKPCWTLENTGCSEADKSCRECNVYRYGAYCFDTMKELIH